MTWELTRNRMIAAYKDMNHEQLSFRLFPNTLTIGEMVAHVYGVEISFASQILGAELNELESRLKAAATDGAVNDNPFPFSADELTPEFLAQAEMIALAWSNKVILDPTPEIRNAELVSALGPVITGAGALARLGYHPGYHHAQIYMVSQSPDFPKA